MRQLYAKLFFTTLAGIFAFTAIFLLASFPAFSQNDPMLFDRAMGKAVTPSDLAKPSHLWNKGFNFTCWNGDASCPNGWAIGSQNHPVIAEAAVDYSWVAALCRYEQQSGGIFGRELGAPNYYFANVLAAKMVALRDARAAGDYTAAKDISESLRAIWAYESLIALATPRKNVWHNIAGTIYTNSGDAAKYDGLTNASAGDRWRTENNIDHDTHGELLGWAIDWKPRSITNAKNLLNTNGYWWSNIIAQLDQQGLYSQTTSAEIFGLTEVERKKLRDVVNGDVSAAKWAARVVANFGVWGHSDIPKSSVKIRIRRTTEGVENVYFHSCNGNKPTQAAVQVYHNGDYKAIRPSYYKGVGANGGYKCWVANGKIHAECSPGAGEYVSMPEMGGNILWEVNIEKKNIVFNGTAVTPAGPAASISPLPDVGIVAIKAPGANMQGTSITPMVTIKNFGAVAVKNIYVSYKLNNDPTRITTWRGSLAPGASVDVTLVTAPISDGSHTMKVNTGGPNYLPDNNTGNDHVSKNFHVGSTPVLTLDAGISVIGYPSGNITVDTVRPVATLINYGQTTISSVNVNYKIDNISPLVTLPWKGSLAPGASVNINLHGSAISPGQHTIEVFTGQPNGKGDDDTSNNSKSTNFTVISPNLTDLELISIPHPLVKGCATEIAPRIVVKNIGPVVLTDVTVNYRIDGGAIVSKLFSVQPGSGVNAGEAITLIADSSIISAGIHTIKAWTSNPNNSVDLDENNDTLSTTFEVVSTGQALPFIEDFESTNGGDIPQGWSRYNPDDSQQWFVFDQSWNNSAAVNNYGYADAENDTDELVLPLLDLTGTGQAMLNFDLCHASRIGAVKYDSLEVLISNDCGQSFTQVWARGGKALNTVPEDSTIFIPADPLAYQNVKVNLDAYALSDKVIIKFVNWSNNGNSTLIDNINLELNSAIGMEEYAGENTLHVFPSPAGNLLTIELLSVTYESLNVRLMNTLGQVLYSNHLLLTPSGKQAYSIDLTGVAAGVYHLSVAGKTFFEQKKILVVK